MCISGIDISIFIILFSIRSQFPVSICIHMNICKYIFMCLCFMYVCAFVLF